MKAKTIQRNLKQASALAKLPVAPPSPASKPAADPLIYTDGGPMPRPIDMLRAQALGSTAGWVDMQAPSRLQKLRRVLDDWDSRPTAYEGCGSDFPDFDSGFAADTPAIRVARKELIRLEEEADLEANRQAQADRQGAR